MPKPGDRVVIEGSKVGQSRREGTLVAEIGRMIRVRWEDGQESLLTPGAGAVQFLPGASKGAGKAAKKAPAGAKSAARKKKAPAKRAKASKDKKR